MGKTKTIQADPVVESAGASLFDGNAANVAMAAAIAVPVMDITGSPLNLIALAKSIKDDQISEARGCLRPGNFTIDAVLKLRGTMQVREDYQARIAMKIDPFFLLQLALNCLNNVTLESLISKALATDPQVAFATGGIVREQVKAGIDKLKEKTLTTCRGAVCPRIAIDVLKDFSVKHESPKAARKSRRKAA